MASKRKHWTNRLLEALTTTGNISTACLKVGITRRKLYYRTVRDPEFAQQVKAARETGEEYLMDLVAGEIHNRAFAGKDDKDAARLLLAYARRLDHRWRENYTPTPPAQQDYFVDLSSDGTPGGEE